MRNELAADIAHGDWQTLVLRVREATGLKTGRLAAMTGVSGETWWRWENKGQRPKDAAVVQRFAKAFAVDLDLALWASGLAVAAITDAGADPRLHGLDPADDVVINIMSLDIPEDERDWMLERRRELLEMRRKQDLRELELLSRKKPSSDL